MNLVNNTTPLLLARRLEVQLQYCIPDSLNSYLYHTIVYFSHVPLHFSTTVEQPGSHNHVQSLFAQFNLILGDVNSFQSHLRNRVG